MLAKNLFILLILSYFLEFPVDCTSSPRPFLKAIKKAFALTSISASSLLSSPSSATRYQSSQQIQNNNKAQQQFFPPLPFQLPKQDPPSPSTSGSTSASKPNLKNTQKQRKEYSSSFVRDAVSVVGPSVTRIDCERDVPAIISLFTDSYREGETVKVSGSGIVVSQDGYLLTNAHVVESARKITITLSNGRSFKAKLVQYDELTDLAVLKADLGDHQIPKAPMGDSDNLQSGDWVIAVGCPVGLDFTVTLGIVSSPKRSAFEVGAPHLKGSYIQTDAALNSGNSGGPLCNDVGEVVGINTMVRTNTEAIGFAIPINRARQIYEILKTGTKPTHAFFGMEVMSLTPDFARIHNDDPNAIRLPEVNGALVVRVAPESPAAACGVRKNDIIVQVNGQPVSNSEDADTLLDQCKPGTPTKLRVLRGENAGAVDLSPAPLDLLSIIEERRKRIQISIPSPKAAAPPQQSPQAPARGH